MVNPKSSERSLKRLFCFFLLTAVLFIFAWHSLIEIWDYTGSDFVTFRDAAAALWKGESPYAKIWAADAVDPGSPWGNYIYPANFACILIPLISLPVFLAKKVYVVLGALMFSVAIWQITKNSLPKVHPLWAMVATFSVGVLWAPAIETIRLGQSNMPVFLLLFMAIQCARKEKDILAGVFLGLACSIKLTPLIIIPLCLAGGRPKMAAAAVTSFFASLLICFPHQNWYYFTKVFPNMSDFQENLQLFVNNK